METSKSSFGKYLVGQNKYQPSTIENYAQAIDILTRQINKHIPSYKLGSLYNIKNSFELEKIYNEWFYIPEVQAQESRQNYRYSNAFKRYIEYTKNSEKLKELEIVFNDYEEEKTEGGERILTSRLAERDQRLRQIAINTHGTICIACQFDFYKKYGEYGKGFIEIHHLVKLRNEIDFKTVKTNPITDLVPLCSNCHRMVHRQKNITLSIDELRTKIETEC